MVVRRGLLSAVVLLAIGASAQPYQSVIQLRNGCKLQVNSTASGDDTPQNRQILDNLNFSFGLAGRGLQERQIYASGYVSNETLGLTGGRNLFRQRAFVGANNTLVRPPASRTQLNYTQLNLRLTENNTIDLANTKIELSYSTLELNRNNWFRIGDNSTLTLNNSVLNYTDFFTWFVDGSTFTGETSLLDLKNIQTWWEGATITFDNSTVNITSENAMPPALYEQLFPVIWANNSAINVSSTGWTVKGLPLMHIGRSNLDLFNSTLTLRDTTVHFVGDLLDLQLATILCDNSTIVFFDNSATTLPVSTITTRENGVAYNVDEAYPLVGYPLGAVDVLLGGQDIDVTVG